MGKVDDPARKNCPARGAVAISSLKVLAGQEGPRCEALNCVYQQKGMCATGVKPAPPSAPCAVCRSPAAPIT
jgi:hypothetical protein